MGLWNIQSNSSHKTLNIFISTLTNRSSGNMNVKCLCEFAHQRCSSKWMTRERKGTFQDSPASLRESICQGLLLYRSEATVQHYLSICSQSPGCWSTSAWQNGENLLSVSSSWLRRAEAVNGSRWLEIQEFHRLFLASTLHDITWVRKEHFPPKSTQNDFLKLLLIVNSNV